MDSSTSLAATSIRSASSSMTTTMKGIFSIPSVRAARALYSSSLRTPASEKVR